MCVIIIQLRKTFFAFDQINKQKTFLFTERFQIRKKFTLKKCYILMLQLHTHWCLLKLKTNCENVFQLKIMKKYCLITPRKKKYYSNLKCENHPSQQSIIKIYKTIKKVNILIIVVQILKKNSNFKNKFLWKTTNYNFKSHKFKFTHLLLKIEKRRWIFCNILLKIKIKIMLNIKLTQL